ncbi:ABC transporter substrate-binding protein, partial [Acinetobacter baumannii]
TKHSLKDTETKRFVEFLSSQQGNTIFKKYGWTK